MEQIEMNLDPIEPGENSELIWDLLERRNDLIDELYNINNELEGLGWNEPRRFYTA